MANPIRTRAALFLAASSMASLLVSAGAHAQDAPPGTPPPDATALVAAPKDTTTVPVVDKPLDGTNATLSAGGQLATGNSRLLALTINGLFESRWGMNGIGASVLGNYGQGAAPGAGVVETAENIQGRVRYDRYVVDQASIFLINTLRQDRFQGLDLRYNLDPGFKYLFLSASVTTLWAEVGYDFQHDVRRDDARIQLDATGAPIMGAPRLDKTSTNHSVRGFVGFKHAFNEEVTLSTGVEYIESVTEPHRWVNGDALFAAKVGAGLAVGVGVSVRYDSDPLPSKKNVDTATTLSLIYAFSDAAPPKPAAAPMPCEPAPPPPPPPPPAANPPPPPVTTDTTPPATVTTPPPASPPPQL
jgi:putative salt-induced outer membrane protein YdiY